MTLAGPGQVAHVLRTRSPVMRPLRGTPPRLACVKHAASVRPEPGSNSPREFDCSSPNARQTWRPAPRPESFRDLVLSPAAHDAAGSTRAIARLSARLSNSVVLAPFHGGPEL